MAKAATQHDDDPTKKKNHIVSTNHFEFRFLKDSNIRSKSTQHPLYITPFDGTIEPPHNPRNNF